MCAVYSIEEAAALLQVSTKTLKRWDIAGDPTVLKSAGTVRQPRGTSGPPTLVYRREDIEAFQATYTRKRRPRQTGGNHENGGGV